MLPAFNAPQYLINGVPQQGGQIAAGSALRFAATGGLVYYTTDGSDPRLVGGGINPAARSTTRLASTETLVPLGGTPGSTSISAAARAATGSTPRSATGTWSSGAAELGYGDGDEATVVGYGPDAGNKYITTYFRHRFTVPDSVDGLVGLTLRLRRDDGAVVYVNGMEAVGGNMPSGDITFSTLASSAVGGDDESAFFRTGAGPVTAARR